MTPATKTAPRPRAGGGRTAAARSATRRAPGRQTVRPQRRVSGPARPATGRAASARAATARAVAAPLPVRPLGAVSLRVLRAGRSLQDSTLLERLVRGRGWILVLGALLFGLVALNVSLLKLNATAGQNAERAKVLRIQNAKLRGKVSRLASGDRLRAAAADLGLVMPEPKKLHYLTARADRDGRQAARNIRNGTALAGMEDLVSAAPPIDSELLAPTPPVTPDEAAVPAAPEADPAAVAAAPAPAPGATGAAGATVPQPAPTGG